MLDRVSGRIVTGQIVRLGKSLGCATLVSTHNERSIEMGDRRLHIEDGRILPG